MIKYEIMTKLDTVVHETDKMIDSNLENFIRASNTLSEVFNL